MRATINASPLIFLARLGKLGPLEALLSDFHVTDIVQKESVEKGLECGYVEAESVRRFTNGHIKGVDLEKARKLAEKFNMHVGEASTLLLAKELDLQYVIVDDRVGIKVAKMIGLKPLSTPFVLLKALKGGKLTYGDFVNCFERLLEFGYHLSPALTRKILEVAKEFEEDHKV